MQAALAQREVASDSRVEPQRRCIVSGEVRPKGELLRFVAGPDGKVVLDLSGKLPGRGLWIVPREDILARACQRNAFAKAARKPLAVPEGLADQVRSAVKNRCLGLLGLAKRSGDLVAGFDKVKDRLDAGKAALLVQAGDAAEDGRRKLRGLATKLGVPSVEVFTVEELGAALGGGSWVHVALSQSGVTKRLAAEVIRLQALNGESAGQDRA